MTISPMERQEQATRHIARMFAGNMSEQEALAIRQWRRADPGNEREFLKGLALLGDLDARADDIAALEDAGGAPSFTARRKRLTLLGAAAGLMLAILVGVIAGYNPLHLIGNGGHPQVELDRYITRVGEQKVVTLNDGSKITLNTGTELLVNITAQERWVRLERGEAFFEIAGDPLRPFNVYLNEYSVSVLGTAFNILKSPKNFTLAVVEGVVSLHDKDEALQANAPLLAEAAQALDKTGPLRLVMGGQHRIAAGTVVDFAEDGEALTVYRSSDIKRYYDWTDGRLYFQAERLVDVVKTLNRYIGKKILIEDPSIINLKIYSVVDVKEIYRSLSDFEKTLPIEFVHYQDRIAVVSANR